MAVEKVWRCDLCGEFVNPDDLRRLGVRTLSDRPEDADVIDVGPECYFGGKPISDVIQLAAQLRKELGGPETEAGNGD